MTVGQFLTAVALGQVTPGPAVQTVAVVGYATAGLLGALVASVVDIAPSFVFVLAGVYLLARSVLLPTLLPSPSTTSPE